MKYAALLCSWYEKSKRDMPWRNTCDPYCIWVSEIMLQQTQVDTVIPYYERFISRYPTVSALAAADIEEVFLLWQGLGYYRRAENLHKGAQLIDREYGGIFPKEEKQVRKIPGIGSYTLGAVLSIAFNKPVPAVDGNVMRVLSRQFEIRDDISQPKTKLKFEKMIPSLLTEEPRIFNQAMMELGALVCTPQNPKCAICPMNKICQAYLNGRVADFPVKTKKAKPHLEHYVALVLKKGNQFWVEKRPQEGLLAGLWALPLIDASKWEDLAKVMPFQPLEPVQHIFTHRRWEIQPVLIELAEQKDDVLLRRLVNQFEGKLVDLEGMKKLAIATAFRKITRQFDDL